ncbi:MAG: hypothetical protein M3Q58_04000 [Bacteroidota bacterium]|nr:hypothetical protein [Bacteroidota bacterium]
MDPNATNYNEKAKKDDGSCVYDPNKIFFEINENITTPTTIDKAVRICGNISVSAALTILPGVKVIMCAGSSLNIVETGSLSAIGTAAEPIIFKGAVATPGSWDYIKFESNNSLNQLKYVTIQDGGGNSSWNAAVYCYLNGRLKMSNTTISNSQRYGMLIYSETCTLDEFSNININNCSIGALNITAKQMNAMEGNCTFTGNGKNHIEVNGGTIEQSQNWKMTQPSYYISNSVYIKSSVTVEPGAKILMGPGKSIHVESSGSLKAIGTSTDPIVFTGEQNTKGYWGYILYNGSNNNNNEFQHVTTSYGGGDSSWNASIYLYLGARFKMGNSTVSNSQRWAIVNYDNQSTFIDDGNNSFSGNDLGNIGN